MQADATPDHAAAPVPADDRCFLYGDGLFETMLAVDGRVSFASCHLDRLQRGAQRLALDLPPDLLTRVRQALPPRGAFVVRLTLSRGSGPRGYGSRQAGPSRLRIRNTPLDRDPFVSLPPLHLGLSGVVMAEQPLLAGIKHCNRLEQVLAADEAQHLGVDECLLLNSRGSIQCAIAANVFLLMGELLITPPCEHCGVAGTRRALVLDELAARCGMTAREEEISADDVRRAEGLVLTSATAGIRVVASFAGHRYSPRDRLLDLQARYSVRLRQCLDA